MAPAPTKNCSATRLEDEHHALRDDLRHIEGALPAFARRLQQHLRFEERELFPVFEVLAVEA